MTNIELYNDDCLNILKLLTDNCIDLVVTSPPYDNLRSYNGHIDQWNFDKFKLIANELFRVTKVGGVVVWIVGDATIDGSETGTSFKQALYFKEIGFNLHDTMIFKKTNPIPQIFRNRYNNEFEYMFVFSKNNVTTCNPIKELCKYAGLDISKSSFKNYSSNAQKRYKKDNMKVNDYKIIGNIWEYVIGVKSIDKFINNHPASFPYQLAYDHIITWSNENDTVLDPFMGSGTTGLACKSLHRNFIGIEIDETYFNEAKNRINQYGVSHKLF